ncbi:MAG: hypothetical protein JXX28_19380 [Deltaproteobacteria bacterium]|nr:hypothetical protein [Deltaproteobacteria bacterium]
MSFLSLLALLGGCHNACQDLCYDMADYAEDCGLTVTSAAFDACMEAQEGDASREDRATCRQANDPELLRSEWSCADLESYWAE